MAKAINELFNKKHIGMDHYLSERFLHGQGTKTRLLSSYIFSVNKACLSWRVCEILKIVPTLLVIRSFEEEILPFWDYRGQEKMHLKFALVYLQATFIATGSNRKTRSQCLGFKKPQCCYPACNRERDQCRSHKSSKHQMTILSENCTKFVGHLTPWNQSLEVPYLLSYPNPNPE